MLTQLLIFKRHLGEDTNQKIPAPQDKEPGIFFLNNGWREAHKASVDMSQQKDRNPHADNVKTGNSAETDCILYKMITSFFPRCLSYL